MLEHAWIKGNEVGREVIQNWLLKNVVDPSQTEVLVMDDIQ